MNISLRFALLVGLGVIAAGITFFGLLHLHGARRALRRWADFNGFELLDKKLRLCTTGFVKWYLYFVKVRDKCGRERSGWVHIRSFLSRRTFGDKSGASWIELTQPDASRQIVDHYIKGHFSAAEVWKLFCDHSTHETFPSFMAELTPELQRYFRRFVFVYPDYTCSSDKEKQAFKWLSEYYETHDA
jgi:hypothetical protein